jgi:t-SNARE complex subunit (syntaxin)
VCFTVDVVCVLIIPHGKRSVARQVTGAYAATKKGVVELQKANDHARKNRKRMCCLWWFLVVALVAILFPLLASSIFGT